MPTTGTITQNWNWFLLTLQRMVLFCDICIQFLQTARVASKYVKHCLFACSTDEWGPGNISDWQHYNGEMREGGKSGTDNWTMGLAIEQEQMKSLMEYLRKDVRGEVWLIALLVTGARREFHYVRKKDKNGETVWLLNEGRWRVKWITYQRQGKELE